MGRREEIIAILERGESYFHKPSNTRYTLKGEGSTKSVDELPGESELSKGESHTLKLALNEVRAKIDGFKKEEQALLEALASAKQPEKSEEKSSEKAEEKSSEKAEDKAEKAESKPTEKSESKATRKSSTKAK